MASVGISIREQCSHSFTRSPVGLSSSLICLFDRSTSMPGPSETLYIPFHPSPSSTYHDNTDVSSSTPFYSPLQ